MLGSDAVTASVDWAVDVMSDRRSSQQKTGDHLSELRSYLYAHPEKLKSLTSRQRYNLDNNIATSDLLEMYTRLSGQRSDRLNALTATLVMTRQRRCRRRHRRYHNLPHHHRKVVQVTTTSPLNCWHILRRWRSSTTFRQTRCTVWP